MRLLRLTMATLAVLGMLVGPVGATSLSRRIITPHSISSVDSMRGLVQRTDFVSGTWFAANDALFWPFEVHSTTTVTRIALATGATQGSNLDVGIYELGGTRLVSSGSTAQGSPNLVQIVDITDTTLSPGRYYMALACSSSGLTFMRSVSDNYEQGLWGGRERVSGVNFPLAASVTFEETANRNYIVLMTLLIEP